MTEAPDAQLNPPEYESMFDIYGTEYVDEDVLNGDVIESELGETIHKDNFKEYLLEYCECKIKTR